MSDVQILAGGVVAAPLDYKIPNAQELLLRACFAHFDGTSAAGAFLPTLQVISSAGATVVEIPMDASVAAGKSVEASWAPFLKGAGATVAGWKGGAQPSLEILGVIAETTPILSTTGPSNMGANEVDLFLFPYVFPAGTTIAGLDVNIAVAGTPPVAGIALQVALFDTGGTCLVSSPDYKSSATSTGTKQFNFTAPYVVPADAMLYAAIGYFGTWSVGAQFLSKGQAAGGSPPPRVGGIPVGFRNSPKSTLAVGDSYNLALNSTQPNIYWCGAVAA